MDASLFVTLIDPAILLFFFGILAGALRSNLEIPPAIAKFCSLYLLLVIGFKGGLNLHETGFTAAMGWALLGAFIMAVAVPAWSFLVLRRRLSPYDAAAVAATSGSVSAVSCITAVSFAAQHAACIAMVHRFFPGRLRGRGQALYSVLGYGLPGVVGGVGGGWLGERLGFAAVFWAASAVAVMAWAALRRAERHLADAA